MTFNPPSRVLTLANEHFCTVLRFFLSDCKQLAASPYCSSYTNAKQKIRKIFLKLFLVTRFRIKLRLNFSNVNTSACIYPPLKQSPPLKSSQNNLSNGGSSAVKTLHKPKQSYIYTHRFVKHSNEKKQKS